MRLNELVHLCALEAAATAQTGGGRDWREEGKARGRERKVGERTAENEESGGEEAKMMLSGSSARLVCASLWLSPVTGWPGIDSWVTLEGSVQGGEVVARAFR